VGRYLRQGVIAQSSRSRAHGEADEGPGVHELGGIIEIGQRVVKGDDALTRKRHPVGSAYDL